MLEKLNALLNVVGNFALTRILPALLIFVIGSFLIRLICKVLTKALGKSKLEAAAVSLILSVLRVVLYILLALIAASSIGVDVTGIVALASVLTLAVSLSVQDALSNLIGGFTLLYTKPFKIDDFAEVGGQSGTVKQIGLTYTKLLTADGKTVSIPNSTVVSSQIINYTVEGVRRVDISIGVSYDSDPALVLEALKKAALVPTTLETPAPYAAVTAYGESTINYVLQVWTASENYWTNLHTVNQNIIAVFKEMGVVLTYPHLNVHLDK